MTAAEPFTRGFCVINISFIGGGNMARAMIGGLINQGFSPTQLRASGPTLSKLLTLAEDFGIGISTDNSSVCQGAQVVILAVKPQVMQSVCRQLQGVIASDTLVISVAAGITCASLATWLGGNLAIVRAMPNTPSMLGLGAAGLFANPQVTPEQRQLAEQILGAVGIACWVAQEPLIDTVTAVSGSGPAYFFLFMEAMVAAAQAQGLDAATAHALTLQTALGAASLAQGSQEDLASLRRRVTSPKGTTEQAIFCFEQNQLPQLVAKAMEACRQRAQTLAQELGAQIL